MTFFLVPHAKSSETPFLFLPGWGFDYRLVNLFHLFPQKNLILPNTFLAPAWLNDDLPAFMDKKGFEKINIIGWSMGAHLGLDFCLAYPERVNSLQVVAMRGKWPKDEIADIRDGVEDDLQGYMAGFYRKCFFGYKKYYKEFILCLQDDYLSRPGKDLLFSGLDYLEGWNMPAYVPEGVSVSVIHGRKDVVAPVEEMAHFPGVSCDVLPHSGHLVLLDKAF